jgi:hypothetical protein
MSNTHLTKTRSEKSKTQSELVENFRDSRLFTFDTLRMLSDTGERLFGRYLPVSEEETIVAVAGGTG